MSLVTPLGAGAIFCLLAAAAVAAPASTTGSSSATAEMTSGVSTSAMAPMTSKDFALKAHQDGQQEVKSAKQAEKRARNSEIKRVARMLEQDHTQADQRLSQIAQSKGWSMGGDDGSSSTAYGSGGGAFDMQWVSKQITDHKKSIAMFQEQAQSGDDSDVRAFAAATLPKLQSHLSELEALQK
jgi:putative membrane protein